MDANNKKINEIFNATDKTTIYIIKEKLENLR